jgi:serine/threonine protein kinase/Tfp pilus assembly protein PilF
MRLEECLPSPVASNFLATLAELVLIDLEFAWKDAEAKANSASRIEQYLHRFPQLARPDLLRQLVRQEFELRQRCGDSPTLEEYQRRFPALDLQTDYFPQASPRPRSADATADTDRDLGAAPSVASTIGSTPAKGHVVPAAPTLPVPPRLGQHRSADEDFEGAVESSQAEPAEHKEASAGRYPRIGRFVIKEEIARGGLGRVLLGHDPLLGRNVAVKEMLPRALDAPELIARFHEEAQITGQLEHPHIVPIHELGIQPNGRPFYAMKLIRGRTLQDAILAYHALPSGHAERMLQLHDLLQAFVSVCHAVGYAHSRHVLHRDLKPANILVGDYGEVLVVDWGLAKVLNPDQDRLGNDSELFKDTSAVHPSHRAPEMLTTTGSVVGTPAYMSPEQARGDIETLQPASDIYSLGAVLYEILTGRRPFTGETRAALLEKVINGQFPPPRAILPSIPRALEAICIRAMANAPVDRYRTAAELANEVSRWQAGEPVSAYREPWPQRSVRWAKRHKSICLATTAALAACAFTLGVWSWREEVRVNALRQQSLPLILNGQRELASGNLETAQLRLSEAAAKVGGESRLNDLKSNVDRLLSETIDLLRQQSDKNADREKLRRLRQKREDALFYGSLFTGLDYDASLDRTEAAAREGLGLFGAESIEPDFPNLDQNHFSEEERREIRRTCGELVLMLAGAMAQPRMAPDDNASNKPLAALRILERARSWGLSDTGYYLQRARCLQAAGDRVQAELARQQLEASLPGGPFDRFLVGLELYCAGDYTRAAELFDAALREEPGDFWPEYFLALCLVRQVQDDSISADRAVAHLNACLSRRPDFAWCHLLRGFVYAVMGRATDAEADFDRAAALGAEEYALLVNRGAARIAAGKYEAARQDLRRAVEIDGNRYQAYLNLAEACRLMKKEAEAQELLDRVIQLRPSLPDAYRQRAFLAIARGDDAAALADFSQAAEGAEHDRTAAAKNHLERGRILHRQKKYQAAVEAYTAALEAWPEGIEGYILRALSHWEVGRGDEALADLGLFFRKMDRRRVAPDLLSLAYRKRGLLRVEKSGALSGVARREMLVAAIDDFTHALATSTGDVDQQELAVLRARRGWAYLLPSPELASVDFEEAVRLDPKSADAYNGRGFARAALGDYQSAVRDAEQAVQLHAHAGDLSNAACIYAQAAAKVQHDPPAEQAQLLSGQYRDAALRLLRQAILMTPPAGRKAFAGQVFADPAFDPIRNSVEFTQLREEWSSEAPREAPADRPGDSPE